MHIGQAQLGNFSCFIKRYHTAVIHLSHGAQINHHRDALLRHLPQAQNGRLPRHNEFRARPVTTNHEIRYLPKAPAPQK